VGGGRGERRVKRWGFGGLGGGRGDGRVVVGGVLVGRVLKADSGGLGSVVVVVVVRWAWSGRRKVGGRWETWVGGWSSARLKGELSMLRDMMQVSMG